MPRPDTFLVCAGTLLPCALIATGGILLGVSLGVWIWPALYQLLWYSSESIFVERYRNPNHQQFLNVQEKSPIPYLSALIALLIVICSTVECLYLRGSGVSGLMLGGWMMGITGVVLRLLSIRQLGPRFLEQIALLPNHELEVDGIYRWMKHPAEMGYCLAIAGYLVICHSLIGLVLFVTCLVPLSLRRIALENELIATQ